MVFIVSTMEYERIIKNKKLKTLGDISNIVKVSTKKYGSVVAEDDTDGLQRMYILAKGDFNHDDIDDITINVNNSVKGSGTFDATNLYVLTKTKKDGGWIVLTEKYGSPM